MRRDASTLNWWHCAGCCTAGSGSTATRCTSICCTRPTSWATRTGSASPRTAREFIERGLALKKAGNRLMEQIGGRAIHPINVRLGGFYSVPAPRDLKPLAETAAQRARRCPGDAELGSPNSIFPTHEFDHELLALTEPAPLSHRERNDPSQRRTRVRGRRLQRPRRRVAGAALHRAARDLRRRALPDRPLARYSLNSAALSPIARKQPPRPGLVRIAETRSAASWFAPSRWCTRSTRRCESSPSTSGPRGRCRRPGPRRRRTRRQRGTARAAVPPL